MKNTIVGVMGPGEGATEKDIINALELGKLIAKEEWITLSGGRNAGVMDAVNKGAKEAGGVTIAIIPARDTSHMSQFVDIPIITGMGTGRNIINVLTSHIAIACGMGRGTLSEIALALKEEKNVILLNDNAQSKTFLKKLGKELVSIAQDPKNAIEIAKKLLL